MFSGLCMERGVIKCPSRHDPSICQLSKQCAHPHVGGWVTRYTKNMSWSSTSSTSQVVIDAFTFGEFRNYIIKPEARAIARLPKLVYMISNLFGSPEWMLFLALTHLSIVHFRWFGGITFSHEKYKGLQWTNSNFPWNGSHLRQNEARDWNMLRSPKSLDLECEVWRQKIIGRHGVQYNIKINYQDHWREILFMKS